MSRSTFKRLPGLRATAVVTTALLVLAILVLAILVSVGSSSGLSSGLSGSAGSVAQARLTPSSISARVSPPSPPPTPRLLTRWRSHGFRPVSAPAVEGRTVLVYGTIGSYLYLFALDSATGAERWHEHASTGYQPSGISPYVVIVDHDVAFFRPDDPRHTPDWAHLVRVDPLTGIDVVASPSMYWESSPDICGSAGHDLCLAGSDGVGPVTSWRFTRPGGLRARTGSRQYRDLGSGVVDLLTRSPEKVAHQDGAGRLIWSQPLASLFGPGVTTDAGWDFAPVSAHVVVGSVYHWDRAADTTRVKHTDLSTDAATAAFDLRTGALLWRQRGVSNDCYFALSVYSGDTMMPLRCAYNGSFVATYPKHGKPRLQTQEVTVTLQRYDPATGRTEWSLPLGNVAFMFGQGDDITSMPVLDETHVLVPRAKSQVVVDLASGAFRAASPRDVFWCQPSVIFVQSPTKDAAGAAKASGVSSGLVTTCSADHRTVSMGALRVPDGLGVSTGRLTLVSTPSGVVAYRAG